ncbi:MAG TPA: hypothetical protein VEC12_03330 [Bacteroidia bacterium]|nr:hypothetical protein [Bacteroidia bacterium]
MIVTPLFITAGKSGEFLLKKYVLWKRNMPLQLKAQHHKKRKQQAKAVKPRQKARAAKKANNLHAAFRFSLQ